MYDEEEKINCTLKKKGKEKASLQLIEDFKAMFIKPSCKRISIIHYQNRHKINLKQTKELTEFFRVHEDERGRRRRSEKEIKPKKKD